MHDARRTMQRYKCEQTSALDSRNVRRPSSVTRLRERGRLRAASASDETARVAGRGGAPERGQTATTRAPPLPAVFWRFARGEAPPRAAGGVAQGVAERNGSAPEGRRRGRTHGAELLSLRPRPKASSRPRLSGPNQTLSGHTPSTLRRS